MAPALSVTRSRNPRRERFNELTHLRIPLSVSYARASNLIVYLRVRVSLPPSHAALVAERVRSLLVPPPRAARLRPARASASAPSAWPAGGGDRPRADAPGGVQNLPRAFQKRAGDRSTPGDGTPAGSERPGVRRCHDHGGAPLRCVKARLPSLCGERLSCVHGRWSMVECQSVVAAGGGGEEIRLKKKKKKKKARARVVRVDHAPLRRAWRSGSVAPWRARAAAFPPFGSRPGSDRAAASPRTASCRRASRTALSRPAGGASRGASAAFCFALFLTPLLELFLFLLGKRRRGPFPFGGGGRVSCLGHIVAHPELAERRRRLLRRARLRGG